MTEINQTQSNASGSILMLPKNTASQLDMLVSGMLNQGGRVTGLVYEAKSIQSSSNVQIVKTSDKKSALDKWRWSVNVVQQIIQNDVIHYHFSPCPKMSGLDLTLCKLLNKRRFIQFWGSDIRRESVWKELLPTWDLLPERYRGKMKDEVSLKRQEVFAKNGFEAITSSWMLHQCIEKDMFKAVHQSRAAVDVSKFQACPPSETKSRPLVLHFPSNPELKGTKYIVEAIEELQKTRDFEFRVVTNMPRADVLELIEQADLIVDQVLLGAYGLAAIEAMAMAKPVVCYIAPEYQRNLPIECPIVNSHPDDLKDTLDELINDASLRKNIGVKGRRYAELYHSQEMIVAEMMEIYKLNIEG